jgi:uncharacterized membrane protein YkvA (DUF1232 family)
VRRLWQSLRRRARRLRVEALALGLAVVPDFFPVLGIVDDLVFIPVALAFAVRFVPAPVLADCRKRAEAVMKR